MANILNQSSCLTSFGNTGKMYCKSDKFNHPAAFIIAFGDQKFVEANITDATTFQAALKASQIEALASRTFLLPVISEFADNTADATKFSSGYGVTTGYSEQNHSFQVDFEDTGIYTWMQLRNWNRNDDVRVYLVTDTGLILGGSNSANDFFGNRARIRFNQPKIGNKATGLTRSMYIDFMDEGCFSDEQLYYIKLEDTFILQNELKGVNNLHLTASDTSVLAFSVKVMSDRDPSINVGETYKTELAVVGAWTFTDKSTGATVAPATVTWDSTNKVFDLTFVAAGTLIGGLVSPKALAVLLVGDTTDGGYESDTVEVTIAAS
jgi:hypothetical protein